MSEAPKMSESLVPETPVESIQPPEIQVTSPASNTGFP